MPHSVIVLLEDEHRPYPILKNLGVDDLSGLMHLCRVHTEYEKALLARGPHFVFETFGLFNRNPKVDALIASKDGTIVIVSYNSLLQNTQLFNERIQHIQCRPLLVLVENCPISPQTGLLKSSSNDFHIEYLANNYAVVGVINSWFLPLMKKRLPEMTTQTSISIGTKDLMMAFENATLPMTIWDHYGRLRIVYLSLKYYGYEDSINQEGWLCHNWKKYKTSIGHAHLWNYSLTRLWVDILFKLMATKDKFKTLYKKHQHLSNGKLHLVYYTTDVLFTDRARNNYVPPNVKDL